MNAKPWYQSATVYAIAVNILIKLLMLGGFDESEVAKAAGDIATALLIVAGIGVDLFTAWGRKRAQGPLTITMSAAEKVNTQSGFAGVGLLLAIAIAAAVLLSGCVTNQETGEQELSNTGKAAIAAFAGELADRIIAESPDKARTIANIRAVAAKLQTVTDAVTVSDLRARVDAEVAKLDISEVNRRSWQRWGPLFQGLLTDYVGSDRLDANAYVRVNEFLALVVLALPPA